MGKKLRKAFVLLLVLLVIAALVFFGVLPGEVEKRLNRTRVVGPYAVSEAASALHAGLFVADLHADSLLWNRDLLERGTYGLVDIPRLQEGNVALQAFTVVTKTTKGQNFERNAADSDNITLLAIAQRWPVAAWFSLKERALYQARRLHDFAARSNGDLVILKNTGDIAQFLEDQKSDPDRVAGFLGIEGAHPLEGDLANVDVMFDAGYRMFGMTHFFDNELGGSAHGLTKDGLSEFGKDVVRRMEELKITIDLAHASPAMIDDVLDMVTRPVLVSHTGVKGTCDGTRNLSDEHVRRIAATGGVIGIGFWPDATCGEDAASIVRAIRYVADLVGVEHVALGSDNDGAVEAPFDISGVALITEALMDAAFTEHEIGLIMGGNTLRFIQENFPAG